MHNQFLRFTNLSCGILMVVFSKPFETTALSTMQVYGILLVQLGLFLTTPVRIVTMAIPSINAGQSTAYSSFWTVTFSLRGILPGNYEMAKSRMAEPWPTATPSLCSLVPVRYKQVLLQAKN